MIIPVFITFTYNTIYGGGAADSLVLLGISVGNYENVSPIGITLRSNSDIFSVYLYSPWFLYIK